MEKSAADRIVSRQKFDHFQPGLLCARYFVLSVYVFRSMDRNNLTALQCGSGKPVKEKTAVLHNSRNPDNYVRCKFQEYGIFVDL